MAYNINVVFEILFDKSSKEPSGRISTNGQKRQQQRRRLLMRRRPNATNEATAKKTADESTTNEPDAGADPNPIWARAPVPGRTQSDLGPRAGADNIRFGSDPPLPFPHLPNRVHLSVSLCLSPPGLASCADRLILRIMNERGLHPSSQKLYIMRLTPSTVKG